MTRLSDTPYRREWLLALGVAVIATLVMLIPYWLGYAFERPGTEFTGLVMNPEDSNSYFAKMLQGYEGRWLYTIPFTFEEHAPAFVGGFYLILGHLARGLGVGLVAMWHLSRVAADLLLFLVTFGFIFNFLSGARARWTAFLLAVFGSGLGWVLFLLNQPYWLNAFPVDFKMPEAHLFFSALTFPHVATGTALVMLSLLFTSQATDWATQNQRKVMPWLLASLAGLFNLCLVIVYPFLIYLVGAIVAIFWLWSSLMVRRVLWIECSVVAVAFLLPAPLVLYYAFTLATNPIFRIWDAQAITLSPPLPHYLVAYGVMLLLALTLLKRARNAKYALLWSWIIAVVLLVYLPINPQRRFVQGVQVPLAILASASLSEVILPLLRSTRLFQRIAMRPGYSVDSLERFLVVLFLFTMSLSNLYVLLSLSVTTAVQQPYPLFRSQGELAAADWLQMNTPHRALMLGAYETGNWIAARVGNRVLLGHWAETVDWQARLDEVTRFYAGDTDEVWRKGLLTRFGVEYVFEGPREKSLGTFDPTGASYLEPVYSNHDVTLFRVRE